MELLSYKRDIIYLFIKVFTNQDFSFFCENS